METTPLIEVIPYDVIDRGNGYFNVDVIYTLDGAQVVDTDIDLTADEITAVEEWLNEIL
jgi:hypothetical protein